MLVGDVDFPVAPGQHAARRDVSQAAAAVTIDLVCLRPDLPHPDAERNRLAPAAAQVRGAVGRRGDVRLPAAVAFAEAVHAPLLPRPFAVGLHRRPGRPRRPPQGLLRFYIA